MKDHVDLIWPATFAVIAVIALLIMVSLSFLILSYVAIIIGGFIALSLVLKILYDGYFPVPAKSKVVLLAFEDFYKVLSPGVNIVFPYFGIFSLEKDDEGEIKYFPITVYPLAVFDRETVVRAAEEDKSSELTEFLDTQAYLIATLYYDTFNVKRAYLNREDYVNDLKAWFRSLLRDYCRTKNLNEVDSAKENLGLLDLFSNQIGSWNECNSREEAQMSQEEYSFVRKEDNTIIVCLRDYGVWLHGFLLEDTILPRDIEEIQKKKNIAQVNKKVAKINAKTAKIVSRGIKKAWVEESVSIEDFSRNLRALGMSSADVTNMINQRLHWQGAEKLEKERGAWVSKSGGETTIIIGDRNAQLGASAKAGGASIANN